jgi:hypothetical protein
VIVQNDNNTKWLNIESHFTDKTYQIGKKLIAVFKKSIRIVFDDHLGQLNYVAASRYGRPWH